MRSLVALLAFALGLAALLYSQRAADPPMRLLDLAPALLGAEGGCDVANLEELRHAAIVYTWVNGTERCYNERRARAGLPKGGSSRDKEMGELKYSIRSLLKFAPWLDGPIYIVTPGQIPDWLDPSNERIRIVDQDDLIPKNKGATLPTFDTNVIEQYLYKIPGLTDIFIHMNDDYLFVKPVAPSRLFSCDGGLRFLTEINHIRHVAAQKANAWLASVRNTVELADQTYGGQHVVNFLKHAPFVYSKRAFAEIHAKFQDKLDAMLTHQLRHPEDLNMPLLHHIYMHEEGSAKLGIPVAFNPLAECDDWLLVRVRDNEHDNLEDVFNRTLANQGTEVLLALNDEYQEAKTAEMVGDFYAKLLPDRTPFELPEGQTLAVVSNYHGEQCEYDPELIPLPRADQARLRQQGQDADKPVGSSGLVVASQFDSMFASRRESFAWSVASNLGYVLGLVAAVVCTVYIYRIADKGLAHAFLADSFKNTGHEA